MIGNNMTKREKEYMSLYGRLSYEYCYAELTIERLLEKLPRDGSKDYTVYDKFVPRRVKIQRLIYKIEKKFNI